MGPIGGEGKGEGPRFLAPPSKNIFGHSYEILNISAESSAQAQSIGTLFEQIGFRGGHVQKSGAHALGCMPWGKSSQWRSKSPQTHRIVPAWDSQWNSEKMQAMWSCASQLWVPGRSRVHGRPYLNFCPITLQHFSFRSWWVCRWMPIWKRSRLVPFLFGWGHWKGGRGRGSLRGVHPRKCTCLPKTNTACLYIFFSGASWDVSEFHRATFTQRMIYFWNPRLKPIWLTPLLDDLIKGWGLGHRNAWKAPK